MRYEYQTSDNHAHTKAYGLMDDFYIKCYVICERSLRRFDQTVQRANRMISVSCPSTDWLPVLNTIHTISPRLRMTKKE